MYQLSAFLQKLFDFIKKYVTLVTDTSVSLLYTYLNICQGMVNNERKTVILNKERNVVLTCFLVGQNKPAVLICPGGGYNECSVSEESPLQKSLIP